MTIRRRLLTGHLLGTSLALSALLGLAPSLSLAQAKIKVAAIYTVSY